MAVDTLGQLLALLVTPANEQERAQVAKLVEQVQQVTGESVEIGFVDQGYTGDQPPRTPLRTAFGSKLSSWKRPSAASCCFYGTRWWSVVSLTWHASAAWPVTMSDCLGRLPVSISWRLR